ncbi:S1C family serine protease [Massilia sp. B-10]|nr:S1C family serine protease [Massilia sp. B-10]
MTADFVVERAARLRVTLADGRRFKARLVGADARTGVALLKIDGGGLPLLPVGDSAALRAAEWVYTVGSPHNLNNSIAVGIVAATARDGCVSAHDPDRSAFQPGQWRRSLAQSAR